MPDREILYTRVMTKRRFVALHLPPNVSFRDYASGKTKLNRKSRLEGPKGPFFATLKREFDLIRSRGPRFVTDAIGVPRQSCNDLVAIHFKAKKSKARTPTELDAGENPNWVPGGKTKNLATGSTGDGLSEFVFDPIPVRFIVSVDDLGHVT